MNIFIKNVPNTYNYGSMMMAENTIMCFLEFFHDKDINFYTEPFTENDLTRLRTATKYENIFKDTFFDIKPITEKIRVVRYFEKALRKRLVMKRACSFYDVVIILGGDDYAETYFNLPRENILIKSLFNQLQYFNKYTKLYMIGQTIGPYTGKRIKMATKGFEGIRIFARDEVTTKYMKDTFNIDVETSRDLAFLDLTLQGEYIKNKKQILKKYNLKENEYIVVVGTGIIDKYNANVETFVDDFYNALKNLKKKYKDKKIVYLCHVVTPNEENDLTLLDLINAKYDNFIDNECIVIKEVILPIEARIILGMGYLTITCRMHAAVSTFQMKKPAICLSYSPKYKGVISEGLELEKLVIDDLANFPNEIIKISDYVDNNYDELVKHIDIKTKECATIVSSTLNMIFKELE